MLLHSHRGHHRLFQKHPVHPSLKNRIYAKISYKYFAKILYKSKSVPEEEEYAHESKKIDQEKRKVEKSRRALFSS